MKILKNKVNVLIMLLILLSGNAVANEKNAALMPSRIDQKISIDNTQSFQDKITALEHALHDLKKFQAESKGDSYPDSLQYTINHINRSAHLDSYDLVVADFSGNGEAAKFSKEFDTLGPVNYVFIGPGSINVYYKNKNQAEVKTFEEGVHLFSIQDDATVKWQDGQLYLDGLKGVGLVDTDRLNHWLYVPKEAMNEITVIMNGQLSAVQLKQEQNLSAEIIESGEQAVEQAGQQGHLMEMADYIKAGLFSSGNMNRYVSPYPDKMLMPKELAITNGLSFKDVTSDQWSNQQLLNDHLNASMLVLVKIKKALQKMK